MPIILCRHGATAKNIVGGVDDRQTKLHPDGLRQSLETGTRLRGFCLANGITSVQPLTSGYDRTIASCQAAVEAFARTNIDVLPRIDDERIGEIKFRPRDTRPTADSPGIFNRVIEGANLAEILARLASFASQYLSKALPGTAYIVFGHRTTHRLLAMVHLKRDIQWMEGLPRMDNCELWWLENGDIEVLHPGYPALRDEPDPRRQTLK